MLSMLAVLTNTVIIYLQTLDATQQTVACQAYSPSLRLACSCPR